MSISLVNYGALIGSSLEKDKAIQPIYRIYSMFHNIRTRRCSVLFGHTGLLSRGA